MEQLFSEIRKTQRTLWRATSFKYVKFEMSVTHASGNVEWGVVHISLELRGYKFGNYPNTDGFLSYENE